MFLDHKISAVLLMGGQGMRFEGPLPKQYQRLSGKKIYEYTLETFIKSDLFDEIILVCDSAFHQEISKDLKRYSSKNIRLAQSGATRQSSSYSGISSCQYKDIVLIHDAVRLFVSKQILVDNLQIAIENGACDTCIDTSDTIVETKTKDSLLSIKSIPIRSSIKRGQTPQTFRYDLIAKAHQKALEHDVLNQTDDCQLVLKLMNHPIFIADGSEENFKITTPLDYALAEKIVQKQALCFSSGVDTLSGKTYVITGGTGGIGKAVSDLLEKEGAKAIAVSRNSEAFSADLTSISQVKKVFADVKDKHGEVDGIINCVGDLIKKTTQTLKSEEILHIMHTNFTASVYSCMHCPLKKGGHIINLGSSSYSRGRAGYTIYSSMKAAIVNFTQGLAEERPDLYVNAIIPSRTNTLLRKKVSDNEDEATLLDPKYVAKEIIEFLKAKNLTGHSHLLRKCEA